MSIEDLDNLDENIEKLLISFSQKVDRTLDCVYILNGAIGWEKEIKKYLQVEKNDIYYNPHTSNTEKRIVKGEPNPSNTLLIIDDSYWTGKSFREAAALFQKLGYPLDKIYGIYTLGGGLQGDGKKYGVPVLATAKEFIDVILPPE